MRKREKKKDESLSWISFFKLLCRHNLKKFCKLKKKKIYISINFVTSTFRLIKFFINVTCVYKQIDIDILRLCTYIFYARQRYERWDISFLSRQKRRFTSREFSVKSRYMWYAKVTHTRESEPRNNPMVKGKKC